MFGGVGVVDDVELFFDLFLVVGTLFEVVHDAAVGVVAVQLGQFLLDYAAFLVARA